MQSSINGGVSSRNLPQTCSCVQCALSSHTYAIAFAPLVTCMHITKSTIFQAASPEYRCVFDGSMCFACRGLAKHTEQVNDTANLMLKPVVWDDLRSRLKVQWSEDKIKVDPFFGRSRVRFRVPSRASNTIARDHLAKHRMRPGELRAVVLGGFPGGLPPQLVVPVLRSCQSPIRIWLVKLFTFTSTTARSGLVFSQPYNGVYRRRAIQRSLNYNTILL